MLLYFSRLNVSCVTIFYRTRYRLLYELSFLVEKNDDTNLEENKHGKKEKKKKKIKYFLFRSITNAAISLVICIYIF